jgi:hypothetical protein
MGPDRFRKKQKYSTAIDKNYEEATRSQNRRAL